MRIKHILLLWMAIVPAIAFPFTDDAVHLKYTDATQFRIINRGFQDTVLPYNRVPNSLLSIPTDKIAYFATNSAGIGIRFCTNSTIIGAKYKLQYNFGMSWMVYTGIKGTDLYVLDEDDGQWHYLATNKPSEDSTQITTYIKNLDGKMHEYLIYLPLYDGVTSFEIGVDSLATIDYPQVENPRIGGKMIFFGTSVMQGGCASRVGMTQTSILQRRLGVECVNLGFSGSAKMLLRNAQMLAKVDADPCAFIVDPTMNNSPEEIDSFGYDFVKMLRDTFPQLPILMIESILRPAMKYDSELHAHVEKLNANWKNVYNRLISDGVANIRYLAIGDYTGVNHEGTVDGIHLTDLGFVDYSDKIEPYLKQILGLFSLVGHRGSDVGVENTLVSFKNGVARGYEYLEADVRVTADNKFVLSHDANLKEWGHPRVIVEKTKLKKLQELTLHQNRWGREYKGGITTLEEFLDYCKITHTTPVIELKHTTGINAKDLSNLHALVELVKQKEMLTKSIFISFMPEPLQWLRENEKKYLSSTKETLQIQFLCYPHTERAYFEWCKKYKIDLDICKGFGMELVRRYHAAGLKVNCWTIDDPIEYEEALLLGVDMLTTNKLEEK